MAASRLLLAHLHNAEQATRADGRFLSSPDDSSPGEMGPRALALGPWANVSAPTAATYQQQGSKPAQHAAPTTQQEAAKAVTEKADALMAAAALMQIDFMD